MLMTDPMQPENWPAWATEAVEIAPANPNWDAQAQEEIRQLKRLLQQFNIHQFEHIGSTSIPGLPAKPIIDFDGRGTVMGRHGSDCGSAESVGLELRSA